MWSWRILTCVAQGVVVGGLALGVLSGLFVLFDHELDEIAGPPLAEVLGCAALVAVLGASVYLGVAMARHRWRQTQWMDLLPRCPKCGYLLIGLTEQRCPECGTRTE